MGMKNTCCRVRAWGQTILGRSILFSLAMLFLMLMMAGMVTSTSQKALRDEIVARNTAQAEAVVEQLARSLGKTMDIQREMLYNTDINRLGVVPAYFSQPQLIQAMLRAEDSMRVLTSSSPLIEESFFMAPAIGKTISADGVEPMNEADFACFGKLCAEEQSSLIESEGRFYILMAYPIYNTYLKENGPLYLLGLKINQKAIAALLASDTAKTNESIYLFTEDGKEICQVNGGAVSVEKAALFSAVRNQNAFDTTAENGTRCLVSSARSTAPAGLLTLISVVPYNQVFSVLNRQGGYFVALILILIAATLAYMAHLWRVIHKPLNKLADSFQQVEKGDFSLRIHHDREDDFAYIYSQFNSMNARLGKLIDQMYMQTIRTQRAELKQLQSQINPHFLYNNLFMIRSLAQLGDTATIETLTSEMGEYFRYVTRVGQQEVPLSAEVDHARNYAQIQDMRFSNRIKLIFPPLPEDMRDITVPRLILQPVLENAYQHGLKETASGGIIRLVFSKNGNEAEITVEDNGSGLDDEALKALRAGMENPDVQETTGLINIHRRLRLRFGEPYGLTFSRGELGGLRVTMRFPASERKDEDAPRADRG
ncbi:MAG: sensor histidine kinase [Clostridia bacterium]|nr:sensor histidine kinase [Clostridia bacterium]